HAASDSAWACRLLRHHHQPPNTTFTRASISSAVKIIRAFSHARTPARQPRPRTGPARNGYAWTDVDPLAANQFAAALDRLGARPGDRCARPARGGRWPRRRAPARRLCAWRLSLVQPRPASAV